MVEDQNRISPWVTDLLCAVGVALAVAIVIAADLDEAGSGRIGAYAFAVAFGLIILVRRRFPVAVLILTVLGIFAYYALDYPPIGISLPAAAAIYSTAEAGRLREGIAGGVVLVSVAAYFRIAEGLSGAYVISYEFVTNVALIAAAVALGVNVRMRRDARAQQELLNAMTAAEQQRSAERQVQEQRMNLARDLHDIVGHSMSVISVHSNVAAEAIGNDDDAAARAVAQIRATTSHTMRELRSVVRVLRSPQEGGRTAVGFDGVKELIALAQEAGVKVEAEIDVAPSSLSETIGAAAYRVVQESLTNTIRHSGATRAWVSARIDGPQLVLQVRDNGRGVPPGGDRAGNGHGIVGMRERVTLLGGYLTTRQPEAGGFLVQAQLPVRLAL